MYYFVTASAINRHIQTIFSVCLGYSHPAAEYKRLRSINAKSTQKKPGAFSGVLKAAYLNIRDLLTYYRCRSRLRIPHKSFGALNGRVRDFID
jgi:hypothetical protein